jgi:hypothetical protein
MTHRVQQSSAEQPRPFISNVISCLQGSMLSWPVWLRVAAVLPVCAILWIGVAWAMAENIT